MIILRRRKPKPDFYMVRLNEAITSAKRTGCVEYIQVYKEKLKRIAKDNPEMDIQTYLKLADEYLQQ